MTTIATDGQIMSCDSMLTYGIMERVHQSHSKIFKLDGCLYGFSGRDDMIHLVREWIIAGADPEKRPKIDEDSVWSLKVDPKGKCWVAYETLIFVPRPLPSAIGSGAVVAETAMYLGMSPPDAVEVAIALTAGSGGPIQTLALRT